MAETGPDQYLREEFNRWAEAGRGEGMEEHHVPIVEPTLALMDLQPTDRVLDVGCGTGWLARRLAASVPRGQVVGIDVSDEMIRRAQLAGAGIPNLRFLEGSAEQIPALEDSFTQALSVESAYYWPSPERGVAEIFRVLCTGGSAWILINYYRDNPYCHQWGAHYLIPAHLRWAEEWVSVFCQAGFVEVTHRRIPDLSATPEVYTGQWFRDADQMRQFKAQGALLISGRKPPRP